MPYRRLDIHDGDSNFLFSTRFDLFTVNISNAVIIPRREQLFPCSAAVKVILFHFGGTALTTRITTCSALRHSYKTVSTGSAQFKLTRKGADDIRLS